MFKVISTVHLATRTSDSWSLRQAWDVAPAELSSIGQATLEALARNVDTQGVQAKLAWEHQAIIEFQDLQELTLPTEGAWGSTNYLFYECLGALRDAVICGCNGQIHASLSVLRSSMEMLLFHVWWQQELLYADSHSRFFDWLAGDPKDRALGFKKAVEAVFARFESLDPVTDQHRCYAVYQRLCSYAHKPTLRESASVLRGANTTTQSEAVLRFWLEMLHDMAIECIGVLIAHKPCCVFPLSPIRKFGFNPPVGVFPDEYNHAVLEKAIGAGSLRDLQEHYRTQATVESLLQWYSDWPDLSEQEILGSWHEDQPEDDESRDMRERIIVRTALMKAKLRCTNWMFAYSGPLGIFDPVDPALVREVAQALEQLGRTPSASNGAP